MRKLLVLGLVGCGGQVPSRAPSPIESTPQPASIESVYEAPARSSIPAWKPVCVVGKRARHHVYWAFGNQSLEPVAWGPRSANRSRATPSRSAAQLDHAIEGRANDVAQCWKWAAARGAPVTRVEIAMTVDPFGRTSDLAIAAATPSVELTDCLAQTLQGLVLGGVTSHASRMHATLDFELAKQPTWPSPPGRPDARDPIPATQACAPVLENAPIDHVAASTPVIVSDADPMRVDPTTVTIRMGCSIDQPKPEKSHVRTAFASNLGAFRACYAEALARDSTLTGGVAIHAMFAAGGVPDRVTARGDGDEQLHACMVAATKEIWLDTPPLDRILHIDYSFTLEPAPPHPTTFESLLASGDGDTALAMAAFEVRSARDAIRACRGRADVVRALYAAAPWRDDPRTLTALGELAAFVKTMRKADARTCLAASDTLREVVLPEDADPRWSAPRLDAALPLAPYVPWQLQLRIAVAEQWLRGLRRQDGLAAMRAIASEADPALADDVRARIAQIGARRDLAMNLCR